ncbi:MAG: Uncharacterised protein [Formosa sp. Hel1_33_131]|nr:MAG: Uncharacterised protein [Formosa sp. Hel1_33_131]
MKVIFINIVYEFLTTSSFFPTINFKHLQYNALLNKDLTPASLLG